MPFLNSSSFSYRAIFPICTAIRSSHSLHIRVQIQLRKLEFYQGRSDHAVEVARKSSPRRCHKQLSRFSASSDPLTSERITKKLVKVSFSNLCTIRTEHVQSHSGKKMLHQVCVLRHISYTVSCPYQHTISQFPLYWTNFFLSFFLSLFSE